MARLGWSIPLPGPFRISGTIGGKRKSSQRPGYHGKLKGWTCPHNHSRPDLARACAEREARRRATAAHTREIMMRSEKTQRVQGVAGILREMATTFEELETTPGPMRDVADIIRSCADAVNVYNAKEIAEALREVAEWLRTHVEPPKAGKNLAKTVTKAADTLRDI